MIRPMLRILFRFLIGLRYRVRVSGLDKVLDRGNSGILFLPNHPALIDPVIVMTMLERDFQPRPLADENQVNHAMFRPLLGLVRAVVIPDMTRRVGADPNRVRRAMDEIRAGLAQGDNILLYPAGRLNRSRHEDLGATSAVESLVSTAQGCRIVLVRSTGLWGSSFSRAQGIPSLLKHWRRSLGLVLANGVFFLPRREVHIEFLEAEDFPREADRLEINRYMERFYNAVESHNTVVPFYFWQGRRARRQPEPEQSNGRIGTEHIPRSTRRLIREKLREMSGHERIEEQERLGQDLAMDSISLVELMAWLEQEFGVPQEDMEGLRTVADCMLAAHGELTAGRAVELEPVDPSWFREDGRRELALGEGERITDLFLAQARRRADEIIIADQHSGAKTYRRLIMAIYALRPAIMALPGKRLGIMLPPSVSAVVAYLVTLFSGKTPVMVNWTVGAGQVNFCLESAGVDKVLTARALLERLAATGVEVQAMRAEWVCLEDLAAGLTRFDKLGALLRARLSWQDLRLAAISDTAAILFTSGSEARPKAVPLSHANVLANLRDFSTVLPMYADDRLLGMLPPFHSLGLAGTLIMPLCMGLRTVYSPNPTEPLQLARIAEAYQTTMLVGTPTFINGILRAARPEQLTALRLAFTGAEKCPDYVYETLATMCPDAVLCEGYGITECSPVVSINRLEDPRPGTIGKPLPSMEYRIVHQESMARVAPAEAGLLLLRGPNVFHGYLNPGATSPFVELDGKQWYNSGDLAREEDGVLIFAGRLKRFIKLGGEMISLPAIEEALVRALPPGEEPMLAVEATPSDDHPEIVLFTTRAIEREDANRAIHEHGLSPLHNVRRVVQVAEIPLLGTGKTDYKRLKMLLTAPIPENRT